MEKSIYKMCFEIQRAGIDYIMKNNSNFNENEIIIILSIGDTNGITERTLNNKLKIEDKIGKDILSILSEKKIIQYDDFDDKYIFTKYGREIYNNFCSILQKYNKMITKDIDMMEFDIFYSALLKINENAIDLN